MQNKTLFTPRRLWLLIAVGCMSLAVASVIMTDTLYLHPCYLCVFQRFLFMVASVLALVAAWVSVRPASRIVGSLLLLCAAGGAAAAGYQVWLQAQPGAEFMCIGGDPNLVEKVAECLGTQFPPAFMATGSCASKELVIFTLSLAEWSLVCFVAVFLVGAWALLRGRSGRAGAR